MKRDKSMYKYYYKRDDVKAKSEYKELLCRLQLSENPVAEILNGIQLDKIRTTLNYNHQTCSGYKNEYERRTEKRLCRCLVCYNNGLNNPSCVNCKMNTEHRLAKNVLNAKFVDFEIPVTDVSDDHIGEIDLMMQYDNQFYALEFKPFWNKESLLRMIAEIITYDAFAKRSKCIGDKFKNYKLGIMFMKVDGEPNEQYNQFTGNGKHQYILTEKEKGIFDLLGISVFCLEIDKKTDGYIVQKLR